MGQHKLTATQLRNLKPLTSDKKYFDGAGLYLLVKTSGSMLWRAKYRSAGKEKTLSIGLYPLISLAKARELHTKARQALIDGKDPFYEKSVIAI